MKNRILMTEIETGRSGYVFREADTYHAQEIVIAMNKLNEETARLTGKAIRFVYSFIDLDSEK